MNYDTPVQRTVEPLLTRYVRVYPERATPAGLGLRLELLGCETEGREEGPSSSRCSRTDDTHAGICSICLFPLVQQQQMHIFFH